MVDMSLPRIRSTASRQSFGNDGMLRYDRLRHLSRSGLGKRRTRLVYLVSGLGVVFDKQRGTNRTGTTRYRRPLRRRRDSLARWASNTGERRGGCRRSTAGADRCTLVEPDQRVALESIRPRRGAVGDRITGLAAKTSTPRHRGKPTARARVGRIAGLSGFIPNVTQ